jgi:hypothetical protein
VKIVGVHCRFDNPTIAVQENGTYGGQGKAAGLCSPVLAALLCPGRQKSRAGMVADANKTGQETESG